MCRCHECCLINQNTSCRAAINTQVIVVANAIANYRNGLVLFTNPRFDAVAACFKLEPSAERNPFGSIEKLRKSHEKMHYLYYGTVRT